jgi:uncharacterized protein (DUF302 family)
MTTQDEVIDHPVRRLLVAFPEPYEQVRERYESLVPEVDQERFHQMPSWQAVVDLANTLAPHGFMRYFGMDLADLMAQSSSDWEATQYLMGNHTIAERMFRYDPSVMLHAPLRILLYTNENGEATLAVDQPSLLFASYQNPAIAAVGRELDGLLAELIILLGGQVPDQLQRHVD